MKNKVINNGSFTAAGNFSGYTALGERIHIYARQMAALGWSTNEDVEYPFYCIAKTTKMKELDANGKETGVTTDRETAASVFKTREAITQAHTESATLDIEIKNSIAQEAAKVGLTAESIDSLLNATV
jgi:enhancing lycopene biosynthesis protein 2